MIGRLGRPHGLKGDLLLDGCSLTGEELEALGDVEWRGTAGAVRRLRIRKAKAFMARMQVRFAGIRGRDDAAELTNGELYVERARLPDPGPGQVYAFQLVGLSVETVDGRALGTLAEVMATGAHPVYVVRGEKEILIPATEAFIKHVDLAAGRMTVDPPPGLEDL